MTKIRQSYIFKDRLRDKNPKLLNNIMLSNNIIVFLDRIYLFLLVTKMKNNYISSRYFSSFAPAFAGVFINNNNYKPFYNLKLFTWIQSNP
jgi:hypothetical protein